MISINTIRKLGYLFRRSVDGIRRKPGLHVLSLLTLAVTFLSFAATLQAADNLDRLLARWIGTAPITVYLKEGVSPEEAEQLTRAVEDIPEVERATPVTPEAARDQFAGAMGAYQDMAASLPASAFPASIDVHLKRTALNDDQQRAQLSARLKTVSAVDEVELYDAWFEKLFALAAIARAAAWGLGVMALVVAVLVVAAVVRTGVSARAREIEVLGLVGATRRYIRFPFQLEGAMETALAMMLALFALHILSRYIETTLGEVMPLIGLGELSRLGAKTSLCLIAGSALAGITGSRLSLKHNADIR
jgi:cell division transport system permease protein